MAGGAWSTHTVQGRDTLVALTTQGDPERGAGARQQMWAQGRAVRNKELPRESFEDKIPPSMENSAEKKKNLIPTHIHNKKLEVCVTARKPGWILEKKPCPSKDADAQE